MLVAVKPSQDRQKHHPATQELRVFLTADLTDLNNGHPSAGRQGTKVCEPHEAVGFVALDEAFADCEPNWEEWFQMQTHGFGTLTLFL